MGKPTDTCGTTAFADALANDAGHDASFLEGWPCGNGFLYGAAVKLQWPEAQLL